LAVSSVPRILAVRLAPFPPLETLLSARPGWKLAEAADLDAAIAIARRHRPDLLLVKVARADDRAEDACGRLRAEPATAGVPILLVCDAGADRDDVDPAWADARLVRPTAPELRSTIAAWLRVAVAETELRRLAEGKPDGASDEPDVEPVTSRLRQDPVLQSLTEGVVVFDGEGRLVDMNRSALAMHGYASVEDCAPRLADYAEAWEVATPEGEVLPLERWPIARALRGETFTDVRVGARRLDGARAWVASYGGSAVRDESGRLALAILTVRDVTEQWRTEQALRDADRRKSDFLAVLSHELRNPLAPIRNSAYVLEHAEPGGPQARRAAEVIERQTRQLTRLVDDLLEVTRVAQGKIRLKRELLELNALVRRCGEDHRPTFADAGVSLSVEVPESPVHVNGDPARLAQVIGNLLANAVKFTEPGGHVLLVLEALAQRAQVRVRDDGVGIPAELLPRVFDPFVQGDGTIDRARGGLGLGLAVLKGLVALHGGRVRAHSDGPGRGTEFVVELPAAPVSQERRGLKRQRAASETARRVLIIEDNADTAGTLKDVLELQGHDVAVASTGPEGIEKARTLKPDVVLCDIGLPTIDGLEVGRTLRADPSLASTRLVAVSGHALPEDVERARDAGFDRHVAKPVDPEELAGI
jgi:PAS domain S-box-containing protein